MYDPRRHAGPDYRCQTLSTDMSVTGYKRRPLVLKYFKSAQAWLPKPMMRTYAFNTRTLEDIDVEELKLWTRSNMRTMSYVMDKNVHVKLSYGLTELLRHESLDCPPFLKTCGYPFNEPGLFEVCTLRGERERDYDVCMITYVY